MNAPYIPDVGDTFTVTDAWECRRWQWLPFPRCRTRVITEEHSYRVESWLRRRPPRGEPRTAQEAILWEMLDEMTAADGIDGPRGAGPDRVPLEWCHREEAEYVSGVGVGGTIQRVADVTVTGRVGWDEKTLRQHRDFADSLAGEPLT
jgi:hypothetical protein